MTEATTLKFEEKAVFSLRSLYGRYGYSQYKMNKFEEYDLYVKNKDFLISDSVITFTDTNGRLMALKPDVTLSIVKNSKDVLGQVQKFYYNENVYRISNGTHSFKEIMQVGLECIGDIDAYCICEVLLLAIKSLLEIDRKAVLCISDLGILSAVLEHLSLEGDDREKLIACIAEKNLHELKEICERVEMDASYASLLQKFITLYGAPQKVMEQLISLLPTDQMRLACEKLSKILSFFADTPFLDNIQVDFSVVSNLKYYNGIVFKGYIEGIPSSVLSGGQYDSLMRQMGRKSGAIGFAVYLDRLERFNVRERQYNVDVLVVYDEKTDVKKIAEAVKKFNAEGRSVMTSVSDATSVSYKQLVRI